MIQCKNHYATTYSRMYYICTPYIMMLFPKSKGNILTFSLQINLSHCNFNYQSWLLLLFFSQLSGEPWSHLILWHHFYLGYFHSSTMYLKEIIAVFVFYPVVTVCWLSIFLRFNCTSLNMCVWYNIYWQLSCKDMHGSIILGGYIACYIHYNFNLLVNVYSLTLLHFILYLVSLIDKLLWYVF